MTQLNASSHGSRPNPSSRAAQAAASQPVASEIDTLVCNIHERRQLRSQTAVERIINLIRIGGDLALLREVSQEAFPDWDDCVKREFDYTPTQCRQLILLHQKWGAWAETAADRPVLERLPCDLAKLELLSRLTAPELEELLDSVDCHVLTFAALRKEVGAVRVVRSILEDLARFFALLTPKVAGLAIDKRDMLALFFATMANGVFDPEGAQADHAAARAADGEELEAADDSGDDEDEQVEDQQNDDHADDEEPAPRPRRRGS